MTKHMTAHRQRPPFSTTAGGNHAIQSTTLLKEWNGGDYSAFVKNPAAVDWSYGCVPDRSDEGRMPMIELVARLPDVDAAHLLPLAPWFEPVARWSARRVREPTSATRARRRTTSPTAPTSRRHVGVLAPARSYAFGTTGVLPLCWLAKLWAGVGLEPMNSLLTHAAVRRQHAPNATANFRACHPPCRWCRGGRRHWMVPGPGCGGGW